MLGRSRVLLQRCSRPLYDKPPVKVIRATVSSADDAQQRAPVTPLQKYMKKYGLAGFATHFVMAQCTFVGWYVAVKSGVEPNAVFGAIHPSLSIPESATPLAGAYLLNKVSSPVRFPFSLALTPFVAQKLEQRGYDVLRDQQRLDDNLSSVPRDSMHKQDT
jgi:hypothetical protein